MPLGRPSQPQLWGKWGAPSASNQSALIGTTLCPSRQSSRKAVLSLQQEVAASICISSSVGSALEVGVVHVSDLLLLLACSFHSCLLLEQQEVIKVVN